MILQEIMNAIWFSVPARWYQAGTKFEIKSIQLVGDEESGHGEVQISRDDADPVTVEFSFQELASPNPLTIKSRLINATAE